MFRCITNITITQQPSTDWPNRKTVLNFDFVNEFESSDSWRDLTNKGKITLPKNLYFRDETGKLQPLKGTNINVGGFSSTAPLFLRGDKVKIEAGYKYFNKAHREIEDTAVMATGYITKVGSKIPIELEIEDNMWILKQTPVETHTFTDANTLEEILFFIVKNVPQFTVKAITQTTFGTFAIGNETAAQVLQRLQKTYGFEFYFRGNELRGGALIYIESDAISEHFHFQENIIDDDLEYKRKDDVTMSALAHNTITESGGICKDGATKTVKKRLQVLVTLKKNPKVNELPYIIKIIHKGETVPENTDGERRTLFFPGAKTTEDLAALAYAELKKYYYTGFKGSFTTFGIPFVRQGDNAIIKDPILPERDGVYKIKKVEYTGGINGLRQKIDLDYKLIQ
jgi:hypothetical protein